MAIGVDEREVIAREDDRSGLGHVRLALDVGPVDQPGERGDDEATEAVRRTHLPDGSVAGGVGFSGFGRVRGSHPLRVLPNPFPRPAWRLPSGDRGKMGEDGDFPLPSVLRFTVRIRPLVALSAVALSAVVLAGCATSAPDTDASPSAPPVVDLCTAAAPSGDASDAVTVEGTVGEESTATFTSPLEITTLQTTVIEEGTGDPVESGQLVTYALSAFNAETGEKLGSIGYDENPVLPVQISPDNPVGQILGCATPGTRVVVAYPPADPNPGQIYVFDFVETVPNAAWGESQEPVDGLPEVTLADDGAPTIEIPDTDAPAELQLETLKKGDGATVAPGDTVLVQYTGRQVVRRIGVRLELGERRSGVVPDHGRRRRLPPGARGSDRRFAGARGHPARTRLRRGRDQRRRTSSARPSCSSSTSSAPSTPLRPSSRDAGSGAAREVISLTSCAASSSSVPPARSAPRLSR